MPSVSVQLQIPQTASPVPKLCSVHAVEGRGNYGDAKYRGNCSGLLIRDLLKFFKPKSILDPMEGSGTSRDVAKELGITYRGFDLRNGDDAQSASTYVGVSAVDFIWLHPPYHDLIKYNKDERCLSQCGTVEEFCSRLLTVLVHCKSVLNKNGVIAVLIGDIKRKGEYFSLPFHTWAIARQVGLELTCPEIIRLQHGATSTSRAYGFSFIPRIHDVCFVFKKK